MLGALMAQAGEGASTAELLVRTTLPHRLQLRRESCLPGLLASERRMWKLRLFGLLVTMVFWAYSLILVYSATMSIARYAWGVQLPNPFSIFQAQRTHQNRL